MTLTVDVIESLPISWIHDSPSGPQSGPVGSGIYKTYTKHPSFGTGHFYENTAVIDGLPASNDSFGEKRFRISIPELGVNGWENTTKVFYEACIATHPDTEPDSGNWPNWFYYYRQFLPGMTDFKYKTGNYHGAYVWGDGSIDKLYLSQSGCTTKRKVHAVWHDPAKRETHQDKKIGLAVSGIDLTRVVMMHEKQHQRDYYDSNPANDADMDHVPDSREETIGSAVDEKDSWSMYPKYTDNVESGDLEYSAYTHEQGCPGPLFHDKDWVSLIIGLLASGKRIDLIGKQWHNGSERWEQ